jgi:C_GCAxxG_C_C family probable redox protein
MDGRNAVRERALTHFSQGYNCAQSVLLAMFEYWSGKSDLIPKIATGFGGGMGSCGSVCGALTGGLMALGIRYAANEPPSSGSSLEKKTQTYERAQRLYKQFETQHGSVLCRELLGYDVSNHEEAEKMRKGRLHDDKCIAFVANTAEMLVQVSED